MASLFTGCQHPKSNMTEDRGATFATDENGVGTGKVKTTNRETRPDGSSSEVTVEMDNVVKYDEGTKSKTGALSVLSKQDANGVTTDRRTSMGGRLKTGVAGYSGETQPDAIKAVGDSITDGLATLLTSGGNKAVEKVLAKAPDSLTDDDVAILVEEAAGNGATDDQLSEILALAPSVKKKNAEEKDEDPEPDPDPEPEPES